MKNNILKNEKGFTLIEMLIVLVVISILVLLVIPNAMEILGTANDQGCDALETTQRAMDVVSELTGEDASIPQDSFDRVCN